MDRATSGYGVYLSTARSIVIRLAAPGLIIAAAVFLASGGHLLFLPLLFVVPILLFLPLRFVLPLGGPLGPGRRPRGRR